MISAYKQVMREYEHLRDEERTLAHAKKDELYEKFPRLREIDEELTQTGLRLAKAALNGEGGDFAEAFHREQSALLEEKNAILTANGYAKDYLSPTYRCERCKDTGYIGNKKCGCLQQRLIDRYYRQSNLGEVLKRENFDQFDFRLYSEEADERFGISPNKNMQAVYKKCMEFIKRFDEDPKNLLFYGDTGLGKTFLCNCIAKDLLDMGKSVLYVTAPRIFKKIEDFRFNRSEQDNPDEQLELLYEVDLLIIDDLGSEFSTVITNTELFNIINTRQLERRPMIISTNLNLPELQNVYSDRIASRLYGHYEMLRLFGDDIRVAKKLGGIT